MLQQSSCHALLQKGIEWVGFFVRYDFIRTSSAIHLKLLQDNTAQQVSETIRLKLRQLELFSGLLLTDADW